MAPDLEFHFQAGEWPRLEDYLESFSELGDPHVLPHLLATERSLNRQFETRSAPSSGIIPAHSSGVDQLVNERPRVPEEHRVIPRWRRGTSSCWPAAAGSASTSSWRKSAWAPRASLTVVWTWNSTAKFGEGPVVPRTVLQRSRGTLHSRSSKPGASSHPNIVRPLNAVRSMATRIPLQLPRRNTLAERLTVENCKARARSRAAGPDRRRRPGRPRTGNHPSDIKPSKILIDSHDRADPDRLRPGPAARGGCRHD